ncbi:MAG: T9SS type A sorting domain-containing protein [bacterium]|nr:T9SS type A sorting domain-containing protein [bacterium]
MHRSALICLILTVIAGSLLYSKTLCEISQQPFPILDGSENRSAPFLDTDQLPTLPPVTDTIGMVRRIGRTWYEGQHNGTIGRMLEIDTNTQALHFTYMRGIDSAATNRTVHYNLYYPASNQLAFGQYGIPAHPSTITRSGFTCLGVYSSSGLPFLAFHENNPRASVTTSNVYFDLEFGVGAFLSQAPMSLATWNGTTANAIWPRIAVGRNGAVHVVTYQNITGEADNQWYHRGVYDPINAQITWSTPILLPGRTENIAAEVAASRLTNKTAIAWMRPMSLEPNGITPSGSNQIYNNVVYVESPDGLTWNFDAFQYITNWRNPIPSYLPDTAAANMDTFRAYNDISLLYDRNDELHCAFTTLQFFRWDVHRVDSLGQTIYDDTAAYVFGNIWHWRQSQPTVIHMAALGGNFWSPLLANPGAWNTTVMRPSLTQDWSTGYLYMVFTAHYDPNDSTLMQDVSLSEECNFDLMIAVSTNNGDRWSYGTNVTNTRTPNAPMGQCRSEHWPSANRWVDDYIHISYITDYDAGFVLQTEGGWTHNDFNYQRIPKQLIPTTPLIPLRMIDFSTNSTPEPMESQSPIGFHLAGNYPNPFNATTSIQFTLNYPMPINLEVFDVQGRVVATLKQGVLNAGSYSITFDAKALTSGVYVARLTNSYNQSKSIKMVLVK